METKTLIKTLILLLVLFVLYVLSLGAKNLSVKPPEQTPSVDEPTFCTLDAKICPDGSAVGRVPPSCEFAACPAMATSTTTSTATTTNTQL